VVFSVTKFAWSGGDFLTVGASPSLNVLEGATLKVTGNAGKLDVATTVGGPFQGTMILTEMNQNLTLRRGAGITVNLGGFLDFAQSTDSDTKGGIVQQATTGTYGYIYNRGGVVARTEQDSANKVLNVGIAILIDNGGLFRLDPGTSIRVSNPVADGLGFSVQANSNAQVMLGASSSLDTYQGTQVTAATAHLRVMGDEFNVSDTIAVIGGDLTINGGTLTVGDGSTRYVTLRVFGNLALTEATVSLKVDGAVNGHNDTVEVFLGTFTLNRGTLRVNTQTQVPSSGFSYTILPGGSGTDFDNFEWTGFSPLYSGVWGEFQPYTLTAP
jgi:hypothetical protein